MGFGKKNAFFNATQIDLDHCFNMIQIKNPSAGIDLNQGLHMIWITVKKIRFRVCFHHNFSSITAFEVQFEALGS